MVYRLINTARDVGKTLEEFVNHEQLLLYNNSEDVRFFLDFTGTLSHS